jgi:hypothetical protein
MHFATNSKAANGGHAIAIKVSDGANELQKAVAVLVKLTALAAMQPTANSDTGDVRPRRILYTK